jgi:hypothetical protein
MASRRKSGELFHFEQIVFIRDGMHCAVTGDDKVKAAHVIPRTKGDQVSSFSLHRHGKSLIIISDSILQPSLTTGGHSTMEKNKLVSLALILSRMVLRLGGICMLNLEEGILDFSK